MGAAAGGAAGAFGGHKAGHGVLGTIGGAIVGSMVQDHFKKDDSDDEKKKKKKEEDKHHGRRNSNSSDEGRHNRHDDRNRHDAAPSYSGGSSRGGDQYEIKPGDTFWALAQAHGTTVAAIEAANPGVAPSSLRPGQYINLPGRGGGSGGRGNFSASCERISLDRDHDLIALCRSTHGQEKMSSISLNSCLSNDNGEFRWQRHGNFSGSARDVRLVDGGRVLEAELDSRNGWRRATIRLDDRITNEDGELRFLD